MGFKALKDYQHYGSIFLRAIGSLVKAIISGPPTSSPTHPTATLASRWLAPKPRVVSNLPIYEQQPGGEIESLDPKLEERRLLLLVVGSRQCKSGTGAVPALSVKVMVSF